MSRFIDDLPESCMVVFDGTSYYMVPSDHELEPEEEVEREFDSMIDADLFCVSENFINSNN